MDAVSEKCPAVRVPAIRTRRKRGLKILEQKDEMDPTRLLLLAVRFLVKHYIRGKLFKYQSFIEILGVYLLPFNSGMLLHSGYQRIISIKVLITT